MKPTDFSKYLTDFFGTYLPIECGVSQNTILTYSYTFSLLIEFLKEQEFINPQRVTLADITKERIINFLQWLEEDRHCSVSTRNARLSAIRSFYSYLQYRDVKGMFRYHEIMSIRKKKTAAPEMAYLTIDGIKLILSQPDLKTRYGRRDFVLLSLLYDSGARVQELIDLTPPNIEFNDTATVKLCGKGNKARIVPLSKQQASNLKKYMYDEGLMKEDRHCVPIFCNFHGEKLSRVAVLNIVKKYAEIARKKSPDLIPENLGCHSFRHSKAMHLLEADINLVYIRDFLGHVSTTTTEIYARASEKKKLEALSRVNPGIIKEGKTTWQKDKSLLGYLKDLRTKY